MRSIVSASFFLLTTVALASAAHAQSLGIGGRFSMIRADVQAETSAERFTGGQVRLLTSHKTALELSLDRRTQTNAAGTERSRDSPLQASLLLFPIRTRISPYLLGGVGWYSHRLETLVGTDVVDTEQTRKFGYHGGFGGELSLGRHAGLHADYRYTFLRFGSEDTPEGALTEAGARPDESLSSRLLPSYKGSMWTAGLTLYF